MKALITFVAVMAFGTALAQAPIEITADEAYDAVRDQVVPGTDMWASVVLVDIRDPLEHFSSGAAAAVTEIAFSGEDDCPSETYYADEDEYPYLRKVRLLPGGNLIEYEVEVEVDVIVGGEAPVGCISNLELEPIAVNVPFWRLTESGFKRNAKNFYPAIEKLARDYDVVILFCRTGGRSSRAGIGVIDRGIFPEGRVYEIDDPLDNTPNRGGFSGPTYGDVYNGYAGFPGRLPEPVSWLDSGLPILTTKFPAP
jgi:rhodanese-related sulfurtransferase